jgi:hypothetical protein
MDVDCLPEFDELVPSVVTDVDLMRVIGTPKTVVVTSVRLVPSVIRWWWKQWLPSSRLTQSDNALENFECNARIKMNAASENARIS